MVWEDGGGNPASYPICWHQGTPLVSLLSPLSSLLSRTTGILVTLRLFVQVSLARRLGGAGVGFCRM